MTRVPSALRFSGHSALGLLSAVLGVFVLAGCPGEIDPAVRAAAGGSSGGMGGSSGGPPCDAPTKVFGPATCAAMVCHGTNSSTGFDMATAGWETHLVGVMPSSMSMQCSAATEPYLKATLPVAGLLIDKISATTKNKPPCGDPMPPFGDALALKSSDIDCVKSWATDIVMKAMNGGGGGGNDAGGGGNSDAGAGQ